MATTRGGGWVPDGKTCRVIGGYLMVVLLTSACAVSGRGAPPFEPVSATEGEVCEGFARKAEAQVRGVSVWASAVGGSLVGAGTAVVMVGRQGVSGDAGTAGAVIGGFAAVGGTFGAVVGASAALWRNAGVRKATYAEAMDACLRPARLTHELGPEHLEVGRSLHALAYRYYRQWDFVRAEPLYLRALVIQEKSLGANAPEVATLLFDYAALLRQTGRAVEAGELEQRARVIRSKH